MENYSNNRLPSPKDWVLTAAHCTHGAVSSYVYLGAHNLYDEEDGQDEGADYWETALSDVD